MLDDGWTFVAPRPDPAVEAARRAESELRAQAFFAGLDATPGATDAGHAAPGASERPASPPRPAGHAGGSPRGAARVPDLLGPLAAELAAVAQARPADLSEEQVLAVTAGLMQQADQVQRLVLSWLSEVDRRRLYRLDGAGSTSSWVAAQSTSVEARHVSLAARLARSQGVAEALDAGRLSIEQARRVAAAVAAVRRHVDRPDGQIDGQPGQATVTAVVVDGVRMQVCQAQGGWADDDPRLADLMATLEAIALSAGSQLDRLERAFVELAVRIETGQLAAALGCLLDALLPNELERKAARGHDNRGFAMTRNSDGSGWTITDGRLDLECGERLFTVLAAEQLADPDNPTDTAAYTALREQGWAPGDPLPTSGVADGVSLHGPRSRRQRAHDALSSGLATLLDAGLLGQRGRSAAHLAVTVSAEALDGAGGALPAQGSSGTTLPASLVRRWACSSNLTRFVLSLGRRVVEVSHAQRTLTGVERRIKHLEVGGQCQGAGCHHPPGTRLIPHHGNPWAATGTTSLDDTVMFCDRTHHDLHTGGVVLRLKDGRLLGPDGWVVPDDA